MLLIGAYDIVRRERNTMVSNDFYLEGAPKWGHRGVAAFDTYRCAQK